MKKTLNLKQLEGMVAQCVNQVITEAKQPKRIPVNEAQLQKYVRNIVNEELENEGLWGAAKGALKGFGQAVSGEWNKVKRGAMNTGLSNEYNGQSFGDRMKAAKSNVQSQSHAGDVMQDLNNFASYVDKMINSGRLNNEQVQAAKQFKLSLLQSKNGFQMNATKNFNNNYNR